VSITNRYEQSHPPSAQAPDIAARHQLATHYSGRLQRELITAKLDGKRSVDARGLLRKLRLHCKRPTIGRFVLAIALGELPDRGLLPEVLQ
jgi:hypothetical protein